MPETVAHWRSSATISVPTSRPTHRSKKQCASSTNCPTSDYWTSSSGKAPMSRIQESFVSAEGATDEEAKAAAETRIPEGSKVLVIRTDDGH